MRPGSPAEIEVTGEVGRSLVAHRLLATPGAGGREPPRRLDEAQELAAVAAAGR
jgi:hypothetical protein